MSIAGTSPRIAIIDYGAGNLLSLSRAIQASGGLDGLVPAVVIAQDPSDCEGASGIILPGVGAAGSAMDHLRTTGLDNFLQHTEVPLLGICLGMQLFFTHSEEDDCDGLGILHGRVRRMQPARLTDQINSAPAQDRTSQGFGRADPAEWSDPRRMDDSQFNQSSPAASMTKIPHMGWNTVTWPTNTAMQPDLPNNLAICAGLPNGFSAYFVHSYNCEPADIGPTGDVQVATAWTEHGGPVCAIVGRGRLWGTQFHPEKSGDVGLALLRNFLALTKGAV